MADTDPPEKILAITSSAAQHKIAQAIYHAVTGKTEKLTREFSENYCIKFTDIEQLQAKLLQTCAQWNVLAHNENITIQHLDDNSQSFSSIEKLKFYDASQTSPVEGITFEFNLLISLPQVEKPQPYKIIVRIISLFAMAKKMRGGARFFRYFRNCTIFVEIEYVDYVVARNILSTLDSWVNEIHISSKNKVLKIAQRFSHWIPRISSAALMLLATITSFYIADNVFKSPLDNSSLLAKFLLVTFAFIAGSSYFGSWVGSIAEWGIDCLQEFSYIEINIGDKRLIV